MVTPDPPARPDPARLADALERLDAYLAVYPQQDDDSIVAGYTLVPGTELTHGDLRAIRSALHHPHVPGLVEVDETTYAQRGHTGEAAVMTHWRGPGQLGIQHHFLPPNVATRAGDDPQ